MDHRGSALDDLPQADTDNRQSGSGASKYSAVNFLFALFLLLCVTPLLEETPTGALVEACLLTFVLVSAIPAIGGDWNTTRTASMLALPAILGKWLNFFWPELAPISLYLLFAILFTGFITTHLLRFILWAPEVDTQVLCAGVSTFVMLGHLWAFSYLLLEEFIPDSLTVNTGTALTGSLTGFDALYFSLAMLTGLSFGEIVPATNIARMMVLMESMTSLFYTAILISRIVALHTERTSARH